MLSMHNHSEDGFPCARDFVTLLGQGSLCQLWIHLFTLLIYLCIPCINFLEIDDKRKKTEAKFNAFSYIRKTYHTRIFCSGHIRTSSYMTLIHGRGTYPQNAGSKYYPLSKCSVFSFLPGAPHLGHSDIFFSKRYRRFSIYNETTKWERNNMRYCGLMFIFLGFSKMLILNNFFWFKTSFFFGLTMSGGSMKYCRTGMELMTLRIEVRQSPSNFLNEEKFM